MKLEASDIVGLLQRDYRNIGDVISVTPLQFSFHVNNQLFLIQANEQKYVLKFNEALNDFYGVENATSKLEAIAKAGKILKENGLDVEETVPADTGRYVSKFKEGSIRLFRFIEGREYSSENREDLKKLIGFSKKLHSFPVAEIELKIADIRSYLTAPYSLEEVVTHHPFIYEKLLTEKGEVWAVVQKNFRTVIDEVERLTFWNRSKAEQMMHVDLHPRNVIIGKNSDISAIDLDYLRIGNPFVCLGLTFTRTVFFGKSERRAEDLEESLDFFESVYEPGSTPDFAKDLLYGAFYIEAEKIFRNLFRYYKTGMYRRFAEDVSKFHYQIFDLVRTIIRRRGY